jgi:TonB family protein
MTTLFTRCIATSLLLIAGVAWGQETPAQAGKNTTSASVPTAPKEVIPYAVGGKVKPPQFLRTEESSTSAELPEPSVPFRGNVLLSLWVGEDGNPSHIQVIRENNDAKRELSEMERRAVSTAKSYRFKAGTKDGKPVTTRVVMSVRFETNKKR